MRKSKRHREKTLNSNFKDLDIGNRSFSEDNLARLSGRLKSLAQIFDQFSLHEKVIVICQPDDPVRELIVVPSTLTERLIRFFYEGPGGAHQASKAISAKILRPFRWIDLKRDVRLYVACCSVCEMFI